MNTTSITINGNSFTYGSLGAISGGTLSLDLQTPYLQIDFDSATHAASDIIDITAILGSDFTLQDQNGTFCEARSPGSDGALRRPCVKLGKVSEATLAQLVERLIRNQQVAGSIPAGGSTAKRTSLPCGERSLNLL